MKTHVSIAEQFLHMHTDEWKTIAGDERNRLVEIASHNLARIWRNGKIKRFGPLRTDRGGKPPWCYSFREVKADWLAHEIDITYVWLGYKHLPWVRGPRLDDRIRADAEIRQQHRTLYLEMDRGTERTRKLAQRFGVYEQNMKLFADTANAVLWIVPDEERRQELLDLALGVEAFSYFALFRDVLERPEEAIWRDTAGNWEAIG